MLRPLALLLALALAACSDRDIDEEPPSRRHLLRVDELPLTTEAELLAAATHAQSVDHLTMLVRRDDAAHVRHLVRVR
jgi:hypothetical protein